MLTVRTEPWTKVFSKNYGYLSVWGINPLLFYFIHLVLIGLVQLPFGLAGISPRPLLGALVGTAFILLVLEVIGLVKYQNFSFKKNNESLQPLEGG